MNTIKFKLSSTFFAVKIQNIFSKIIDLVKNLEVKQIGWVNGAFYLHHYETLGTNIEMLLIP